jgi:dihydroxyacetone kinase-like predicted kinase
VSDSDLARFRAAVAGGLAHLESRRQEVNDLNVFPVADGDTGDNMALTLRAVLAELDRLQEIHGDRPIDAIGRAEIVESVARAALLGARGNSGVILSQLIRGAAEELVSRPGELVDATLIGAAIANASDKAYSSVRQPAEGTILTVAREMARMIASDVAHASGSTRLESHTSADRQDKVIADTLERGVIAGQEAVKRGPEMLAALREAGVVDAGGYGLTIIFAGVVAALRGEAPPELEHHAPARITHPQHTSGTYRYCTNFAVTGVDLRPAAFIAPLEGIGDSVLVVGDSSTLKVHVHTDEPERAAAVFDGVGEVSRFDVADMRLQVAERDERLAGTEPHDEHQLPLPSFAPDGNGATPAGGGAAAGAAAATGAGAAMAGAATAGAATAGAAMAGAATAGSGAGAGAGPGSGAGAGAGAGSGAGAGAGAGAAGAAIGGADLGSGGVRMRCGALAVTAGAGIAGLLEELGAHVIDGGPTLNPSTYELLAGIHEVQAEEVVVLPGSRNVVMAAERAAELSDKQVMVVSALSQQASLAAAVALMPDRDVRENAEAMRAAIEGVRIGAVAPAARDDAQGRFQRGQAVGFLEGEVVAWGEPQPTLLAVMQQLAQEAELISVLLGEGAPLSADQIEAMVDGSFEAELELREGGQPAYWWLLSAE